MTHSSDATAQATLQAWVDRLLRAHERVGRAATAGRNDFAPQRRSLMLAAAALRYLPDTERPPQIAVLGPTQVGKSTVANLLLGAPAAEVSPLAGFTVHPCGFALPDTARDGWSDRLLPGWRRRGVAELTREELDTYALETCPAHPTDLPEGVTGPAVVWDTPDFDSLAAAGYVRGVLEIAALADIHVFVLSREKYADLTVWQYLALLAPLARPTLISLNKMTSDAEPLIRGALQQRLHEHGPALAQIPIVTLPFDAALGAADPAAAGVLAMPLRNAVQDALARVQSRGGAPLRSQQQRGVRALLRAHWEDWHRGLRAEHAAASGWQETIQLAGERFLRAYDRDYLEHPQRYDSFRQASIELLRLLELPYVGSAIAQVRQAVTWPVRTLLSSGRGLLRHRRTAPRAGGVEAEILVNAWSAELTGLERELLRKCQPHAPAAAFWQALATRLAAQREQLLASFELALQGHHARVQQEITGAARRLYLLLQEHPQRLNLLRTLRTSLDLSGVLLALKTGGMTPFDAVWAPAAFGLTSLLTEGATGLEMRRVNAQLKARQRAMVVQELVEGTLRRELLELPDQLDDPGVFGIAAEDLAAAEHALATWEAPHGT